MFRRLLPHIRSRGRRRPARRVLELRDEILAGLDPVPTGMEELTAALIDYAARVLGRPVHLRYVPMEGGVSGLTVEADTFAAILVEAGTTEQHQLVIIGHELAHLLEGHCSHTAPQDAVRAALDDAPDLERPDGQLAVAARHEFDDEKEEFAETLALYLSAALRPYLAEGATPAAGGVAERVQASLGHRRGRAPNPGTHHRPPPGSERGNKRGNDQAPEAGQDTTA
ncbi:toxin-antitoxin system, toxin component (plasmid) [Streptomyces sp. BI20]|uniref:toxin-antitoxin system, toxin component n=1 Tax=Streptomyces sp. BI20 TaxID=3403460 RepID=UPI003C72A318